MTTQTRPYRSGHCGRTNPAEIHRQCAGTYYGCTCVCDCHTEPEPPAAAAGPVLVPVEVGSVEWLEARREGVTASEIAGVLGIAPDNWTSPFNLYWRKKGQVADERDNPAMAMGHDMEQAILRRFAREHPELDVAPGALYRHGADPRWMATPDGLAYEENAGDLLAVVQAKVAGTWEHWGDEGTDDIPIYYVAQVRWEMHVMCVRTAFVPVLVPPFGYREYVVDQDDDDVAYMLGEAEAFMRRLAENRPPHVDWRESTTVALKQLHPDVDDLEVEVPGTWHRQWQLADQLEKAAAKRKALAENRIRDLMGRARLAVDELGLKVASRSVYEMKERTLPPATVNRLYVTRPKVDKHAPPKPKTVRKPKKEKANA